VLKMWWMVHFWTSLYITVPKLYCSILNRNTCCRATECHRPNPCFASIPRFHQWSSGRKPLCARLCINSLMGTDNYSDTSNNMKLVRWPLMGGLLHLVYCDEGTGRGRGPAHASHRCTKCNSPPINDPIAV